MIPFYSLAKYSDKSIIIYIHYGWYTVPYLVFNSLEDLRSVRDQYEQILDLIDFALEDGIPDAFKEAFDE